MYNIFAASLVPNHDCMAIWKRIHDLAETLNSTRPEDETLPMERITGECESELLDIGLSHLSNGEVIELCLTRLIASGQLAHILGAGIPAATISYKDAPQVFIHKENVINVVSYGDDINIRLLTQLIALTSANWSVAMAKFAWNPTDLIGGDWRDGSEWIKNIPAYDGCHVDIATSKICTVVPNVNFVRKGDNPGEWVTGDTFQARLALRKVIGGWSNFTDDVRAYRTEHC